MMSRAGRMRVAAMAALLALPAAIILLNALAPDAPPEGLEPSDQYILPSEAWPVVLYLVTPATIAIVAMWGLCVLGLANLASQFSTLFITCIGVVLALLGVTPVVLLWRPDGPLALYASAGVAALILSAIFCFAAGLPWWIKRVPVDVHGQELM